MSAKFTMFCSKTISKRKIQHNDKKMQGGKNLKMSVIHKTAVCKVNISLK